MTLLKALGRLGGRERGPAELARWLALPEAEVRPRLTRSPALAAGVRVQPLRAPEGWRPVLHRPPAATGYVRGRSIVDTARPHTHRPVVINVDLADFFPS